jgi:3-deoxy-D-manno-octulosonic-acid transferase
MAVRRIAARRIAARRIAAARRRVAPVRRIAGTAQICPEPVQRSKAWANQLAVRLDPTGWPAAGDDRCDAGFMVEVPTSIICAIDTLKAKTVSRILLPLYSLLMVLVLVLTAPWWLWQMMRTGKYREGLGERLGRIPRRLGAAPAQSVWVHAVSVGEVLAASRMIEELGRARPGMPVYVSTTTRTGQALARERFGAERVFYFPLDFAFAMRAWLRFLRPALVVLVESEFWPRMLAECRRAGVPVAVVNGRVSDRSWPRYRRLRVLWRPLLGTLTLVLAQSARDAERLRALGAAGGVGAEGTAGVASVVAAGNLKYDIRVAVPAQATGELQARLAPGVRVVVCGSTLAGEEELLLDALPLAGIVTVLAPRHPERFDAVARLLAGRGLPFVRRSEWAQPDREQLDCGQPDSERNTPGMDSSGQPIPGRQLRGPDLSGHQGKTLEPGTVVLLDSVGELASVYSLATLAVLGGGFLFAGGHNPLEPAQFGVPVLMGAQYANFRDVVEALLREQAVVLSDPAGLRAALGALLADPDRLRAIGARGRRVFEQQAGATTRTLAALLPLIDGGPLLAGATPTIVAVKDGSRGEQVLR